MSAEHPTGLPRILEVTLRGYRRRRRLVSATGGAFLALGVFLAGVGIAVLADRLLRLPDAARAVFLATILATLAYGLTRWVAWPLVRRLGDRRTAVALGRRYPDLEEDLVSAVELSDGGESLPGVSRSLVASALAQIARRARAIRLPSAVPLRPAMETAAVFLTVLLALAGAYALRPEAVTNAVERLLRPGGGVPFFSYVRLRITPGDKVVARGDRVVIEVAASGREVETARLNASTGGRPITNTLQFRNGRAAWQSGPLFEDLTYQVAAGDAISDRYRVRVVPPPAIKDKSAVVRAPAYAGAGERTVEELLGALEIIKGSSVAIRVAPVERGESPQFNCTALLRHGDELIALRSDDSGGLRSDFFTPDKSGEWSVTLQDGFGLTNRAPESLYIKVVPDNPPVVRITRPGRDLLILASESVDVIAEAVDEFGVRDLAMMTRIIRKEEAEEKAAWKTMQLEPGGPTAAELKGEALLDARALGLEAGDKIEYRASAADFAGDPGSRKGFSEVYRIAVMSEMNHLKHVLGRLKDIQMELLRLAAAQRGMSQKAGDLAAKAATEAVNKQAGEAAREERADARSVDATARRTEDLLPELARNPSTPVKTLAELERLARAIRSVSSGAMKSATQEFSQAAQADQGKQAPSLEQAQNSTRDAARRLEQLARLAQRLQRKSLLEKLAMDAERLAALQRELKDATPGVAVKTVGRDRAELPAELSHALERLSSTQRGISNDVAELARNIDGAEQTLAYSNPGDAAIAEEAGDKVERSTTISSSPSCRSRAASRRRWTRSPKSFAAKSRPTRWKPSPR